MDAGMEIDFNLSKQSSKAPNGRIKGDTPIAVRMRDLETIRSII
jgi:hypothetical protein